MPKRVAGGRAEEGKGGTCSGCRQTVIRHYLPPVKPNHWRFSLRTLWERWEHQRKEFLNPLGTSRKSTFSEHFSRNCDLENGMGTLGSQ
jgi:hypothetical protein